MVDYEKAERDHQRRVGHILSSSQSAAEKQGSILALERFRDADIATGERLEREAAERTARLERYKLEAQANGERMRRQRENEAMVDGMIHAIGILAAIALVGLCVLAIWSGAMDATDCAINHVQSVCNSLNGR